VNFGDVMLTPFSLSWTFGELDAKITQMVIAVGIPGAWYNQIEGDSGADVSNTNRLNGDWGSVTMSFRSERSGRGLSILYALTALPTAPLPTCPPCRRGIRHGYRQRLLFSAALYSPPSSTLPLR
jgi:hypothetical protein